MRCYASTAVWMRNIKWRTNSQQNFRTNEWHNMRTMRKFILRRLRNHKNVCGSGDARCHARARCYALFEHSVNARTSLRWVLRNFGEMRKMNGKIQYFYSFALSRLAIVFDIWKKKKKWIKTVRHSFQGNLWYLSFSFCTFFPFFMPRDILTTMK